MGLFAALARPPRARIAQCVVYRSRTVVKLNLSARKHNASMAESPAIPSTPNTSVPKRAMVLAAGLGTRMRAFNGKLPKPLIQVGGKALIDYVLDRLAEQGVERAVVNVHHLADQIEHHIARRERPRIVISDERKELLGTAGGVIKALPQL